MARKKTSAFEDLVDTTARLPWQAGIILAVITYGVLHYFASRTPLSFNLVELKAAGKTMADPMVHSVTTTLASIFQYVLPIFFLLGSWLSFSRRRRQGELHRQVASDPAANALEKMTWREFEGLAAEAFRKEGYRVVERGGDGPDGGVDLELHMGNDKYLVQCKQWKVSKVGVATVRELYGVMTAERAVGGFVVASGAFTDEAKEFAEGRSIRLVDARRLRAMIGTVAPQLRQEVPVPDSQVAEVPACPKCSSPMVERKAKVGKQRRKDFLGVFAVSGLPGSQGLTELLFTGRDERTVMCGRYALYGPHSRLREKMLLAECPDYAERYNIAPQSQILVIRQKPGTGRVGQLVKWGLIPSWANDPSIGNKLNNARGETVAEKPAFRLSFARHRCLIPANGFYEWKAIEEGGRVRKQPYYIHPADPDGLFAFAGLLAAWKSPEGETIVSACIITTEPNEVMAPIHDRMPVILAPEQFDAWLDPGNHDTAALTAMLMPSRPELMSAYPVSPAINSGRVEGRCASNLSIRLNMQGRLVPVQYAF